MLEVAMRNTDRLIRLVSDILDIERIESGRMPMQLQPENARELVQRSVESITSVADAAGIKLVCRAEPIPLIVDPDKVQQTLTNLLSNAIKFSDRGSEVGVEVERQNGSALFSVRDQGRGIPADKLETIFRRFEQVDPSDSRQKGGTGLGLAIARSIVRMHGGQIWVESTLGRGSTFFFTVPLAEGSSRRAPAA
jgi:signal transduction histidine kinase